MCISKYDYNKYRVHNELLDIDIDIDVFGYICSIEIHETESWPSDVSYPFRGEGSKLQLPQLAYLKDTTRLSIWINDNLVEKTIGGEIRLLINKDNEMVGFHIHRFYDDDGAIKIKGFKKEDDKNSNTYYLYNTVI